MINLNDEHSVFLVTIYLTTLQQRTLHDAEQKFQNTGSPT
jgi:hypothetical protein